jgi:thioredoxin reductase (NADPH)
MESLLENIIIYSLALLLCLGVVWIYLRKQKKTSQKVEEKIQKAKQEGLYEPVSLHPVIDVNSCIATGACISACPEKDILGIKNGKATTINASACVGHGACFMACPTQAITLCIGTEKRGVDLPHVNQNFESNVQGIYISGELGGMGLIKNAVEQGRQAVENIVKSGIKNHSATYDILVIGAGPAGISASLTAKKNNLRCLALEQDTLGGAVFNFPRSKIVMTSTMTLPLYGKVKLLETSKSELLDLWHTVISTNKVEIKENTKVEGIVQENGHFRVDTANDEKYTSKYIILAIGRRGSPRKLGIPGENLEKVAYRLLEPELISGKKIMVVGGGDSAVESAMLLADQNKVILSYRGENFSRLKPKNNERIQQYNAEGKVDLRFNTNLLAINHTEVILSSRTIQQTEKLENDLVFIFAGGELPTQLLIKCGIEITKKFGETILKHR